MIKGKKLFRILSGSIGLPALALLFSFFSPVRRADKNFCAGLIMDMADSVAKIKTVRYHLKALEKVNDKYQSSETDIKMEINPKKIYLKNVQKKLEVLYRQGEHGNHALVKPHVFPYTSLYLDPFGSLMRKNQHYTLHELGFAFIANTIKSILLKDPEHMAKHLTYLGVINKCGQPCYMVMYENKDFSYYDYVVGKDESVATIALKKHLSDYMIRSKNGLTSYDEDIKQGKILKIPNTYCCKAVLFISEKSKLPVAVNLYDEKDLWESYEYSNTVVNKPIDNAEFTRGYKDYHF